MPQLRVNCVSVSIDGFSAGPDQSLANPMGVGGMALHEWVFPTRTFKLMHAGMGLDTGDGEGTTGVDDDFAARGFEGVGAWIIGRNMFGPVRGAWPDNSWKGWWGPNPPFHTPVYVLTHHARNPLTMEGGTTFHFVTGGLREAYESAMAAAGGRDVRLGGGASVIRQFLAARLVDVMHLAVVPVLLSAGEHLFSGINLRAMGYEVASTARGEGASHVVIRRSR